MKKKNKVDKHKYLSKSLLSDLETGNHSLKNNPSLPDEELSNFVLKLFSDRYDKLYAENTRVLRKNEIEPMDLVRYSYTLVQKINKVEFPYKEELEQLAIEIVCSEFDIDESMINFDVEMVDRRVDFSSVQKEENNDIEFNFKSKEHLETMKLEVYKRRVLNALIQGASNRFNHIYHLYKDELNAIDPRLVDSYQIIMSSAELAYFMIETEHKMGGGIAQVILPQEHNVSDNPNHDNELPTVKVRAITFPLLVHELIKGVLDLISLQGLPDNAEEVKYIYAKADFYDTEVWDMILGVGLWEKFIALVDREDFYIKHHIFHELVMLPVEEFHEVMGEIFLGTDKAKRIINKIVKVIRDDLNTDSKIDGFYGLNDYDDDYTDLNNIDFTKLF